MRYLSLVVLITLFLPAFGNAQTPQDTARPSIAASTVPIWQNWSERRTVATILSAVIPGAGQSSLGHTTKGAVFTISFLATGMVAVLSEIDVIGRNERLDELKSQYAQSVSYVVADDFWRRLLQTKGIVDDEAKRRNLYYKVAAAVWVLNMVDMVFLTDDRGERTFGSLPIGNTTLAIVPDRRNGMNAVVNIVF